MKETIHHQDAIKLQYVLVKSGCYLEWNNMMSLIHEKAQDQSQFNQIALCWHCSTEGTVRNGALQYLPQMLTFNKENPKHNATHRCVNGTLTAFSLKSPPQSSAQCSRLGGMTNHPKRGPPNESTVIECGISYIFVMLSSIAKHQFLIENCCLLLFLFTVRAISTISIPFSEGETR